MRPAPPHLRALALQLLAKESVKNDGGTSAAFVVCAKLGVLLSRLAGAAGYRSLLARALTIASREVPWLKTLVVQPDGSFQGLEEARATNGKEAIDEGGVILVAHVLELLHTFIGEALTLQLVKEAWPDGLAENDPPIKASEP